MEGLPHGEIGPVDLAGAAAAAPLRARGIRMPDVLILATALVADAEAIITNDRRPRSHRVGRLRILLLDDYL